MNFKKFLKTIYHLFRDKHFPTLKTELVKALKACNSLLDVGCGSNSPLLSLAFKYYLVGIDKSEKVIEKIKKKGIYDNIYEMDAINIGKKNKKIIF